ncbi:MAG: CBS domain-containing protein [Candidatus Aenigmarchaeota archaeon]|nr:CBS domain-containing protein [Candidatus Aenigmarchaeota archaeon]MBU5689106.1 CBS domain-containing protein [Candidatus Aenigmarchaeota archaeon]
MKHKIKKIIKKIKKREKEISKQQKREKIHSIVKHEIKEGYVPIETPVKNIMSTNLKVVEVGQNLREVLELLGDFEITGVPVKQGNKVVGVISDTDIMRVMREKNLIDTKKDFIDLEGLENIKVEQVMSSPPITINQNERITDASDLMIKHKIDRLIVVDDNNKTVGIITREDVVKGLTAEFFLKAVKKSEGNVINSNVDLLLSILRKKGSVGINTLAKEMRMNVKDLEDLVRILENKGIVEVVYPLIGGPKVKVKT